MAEDETPPATPRPPEPPMTLGMIVLQAMQEADIVDTCILDSRGKAHFQWNENAATQLEFAMRHGIAQICRNALLNDGWINEAAAILEHSYTRGDNHINSLRRGIGHFILKMFGVELPKQPKLTIVGKDGV